MFEILVGVHFVCFLFSMAILIWNYRHSLSLYNSKSFQLLNLNLSKIGLFWSNSESHFKSLSTDSIQADGQKSRRHSIMLGLLSFAGLPGFLLLLAVILSIRYLARPRRERFVFSSELVTVADLSVEKVKAIVEEAKGIY